MSNIDDRPRSATSRDNDPAARCLSIGFVLGTCRLPINVILSSEMFRNKRTTGAKFRNIM